MPKNKVDCERQFEHYNHLKTRHSLSMFNKKEDAAKTAISAALQTGMRGTTVDN